MNAQKLCVGDLVLIPKFYPIQDEDDWDSFSFYRGKLAVVRDIASGNNRVALAHSCGGNTAWWPMSCLVFLEPERQDIREEWDQKRKELDAIYGDLDWIFGIPRPKDWQIPNASVQRLFTELGGGDIWGSRGEGFVVASNTQSTMLIVREFLLTGDRDGFIKCAASLREHRANRNKNRKATR